MPRLKLRLRVRPRPSAYGVGLLSALAQSHVGRADRAFGTDTHRQLRGPYVFCEASGARLTHSMVKGIVPATCRRAGLGKRITTHGLRHTFASHLVMRGASLRAVQELLGHESIEMPLRYSHLTPDVKREAVQLLDWREKLGDIRETEQTE